VSERFNGRQSLIRESRALLLDFINQVYPASLAEDQLLEVMAELPEPVAPAYLARDLGYLEARGLVAHEWAPNPATGERAKRWKLTADGVTFMERGKPWDELEGAT
jgi:hypothetical protein